MPFTVAHAAAVLPLRNSRLPLAALMIGSMSPDFAYFQPFDLARVSTHNLEGILFFCLPVGLAAWLLFVRVLEQPTIELLPAAWRDRVPRSDRHLSLSALLLAGIAVALGAATHIAWDAFTHANTPLTNAFPALEAEVFRFHGRSIRMFFILQCLSSLIGMLALAIWAFRLRHAPPRASALDEPLRSLPDRARVVAVVALIATSAVTALMNYATYPGSPFEHRIFHLLIGGMTGWFLGWCTIAVLINRGSKLAR